MIKQHRLSTAIAFSFMLTACGGDGGSGSAPSVSDPIVQPKPVEKTAGRLVLGDGSDTVYIYDLDNRKINSQHTVAGVVSGIYSSPNQRYAVLLSKTANQVYFLNSGLNLDTKGLAKTDPTLLNFNLSGATPNHYRAVNGQVAVFYDGNPTTASSFDLFNEESLSKLNKLAGQVLPQAHHGVAEPRGEYVLSSQLQPNETQLNKVALYQQHGDHFHQEDIFDTQCPKLHGVGSNEEFSVFGCEDGVLVVQQQGDRFNDFKIPLNVRLTQIIGAYGLKEFAGFATGSLQFFAIDPAKKLIREVNWANDAKQTDGKPVARLQHVLSQDQRYLFILDNMGSLHILNTATWQPVGKPLALLEASSTDLSKSRLTVSADSVFVTDASNKLVITVNISTLQESGRIHVPFEASLISWLGVKVAS